MHKFTYIVALLCLSGISTAQENRASMIGIDVGVRAGTTGAGVDLSMPVSERFKLRASYNTLEFDYDLEDTQVSYETQFDMTSYALLFDWHPFKSGLRFSAGAHSFMTNSIAGTAVPATNQTITLNNTVYNAADLAALNVDVRFEEEEYVPYVGFGWGNPSNNSARFTFTLDVGAINIGTPQIGMTFTCIDPILCATIDADVAAEIQQLQQDVEDFEWWPVLSLGFSYRF